MTSHQNRSAPSPHPKTLELVAAALGESQFELMKRGPKVMTLTYDLIETNAQQNRKHLPSICARIDISALMLDTMFRSETDDYLDDNTPAAEHVLRRLKELQKILDSLTSRCERTARNAAANCLGT